MLAAAAANALFGLLHVPRRNAMVILFFCLANVVQAGMGAWLVRRFVAEYPVLRSLQEFFGLLFFAGVVSPAVGATIEAAMLAGFHLTSSFGSSWKMLWGGNVMAVLVLAPLTLAFSGPSARFAPRMFTAGRVMEGGLIFGGLAVFGWWILVAGGGIHSQKAPSLVLVLWAGLRFGLRGGALAVFLLALWFAYLTSHCLPGHSDPNLASDGLAATLQLFVATAALVGMAPAIVLDERDRTMARLRDSEERFRTLTESAFEGILVSENGRLTDVSDQGARLFGGAPADLLGKHILDLTAPASRAVVEEALRSDQASIIGYEMVRLNGSTFFAEARARTVSAGDRRLRMTALRDITERRQAEQSLRESEEKFSKAFRASPDGLAISELETGRYLEINEGYCRIFGFAHEEMLGRTSVAIGLWTDPQDRPRMVAALKQDGEVRNFEVRMRARNGEIKFILLSAEAIELQGISCLVSVLHDMTRRKQAEESSQTQRNVLEMIASGRPMTETLDALLRMIEAQFPDLLCSVLLLDAGGVRLRHCAAPSLPVEFLKVIDALTIGPGVGSCGTAAFRREPVYVADIATDPLWADFRQLASPHGLRSCWSTPIFDAQRNVLGTFAAYRRLPGLPDERHQQAISMVTHTAAICISRHHVAAEREQALAREQQARIEYTLQLIAAQEAERKRIAVELHDSMGQNLLLIKNLAHLALPPARDETVQEHIATINHLAGQCIAEARRISRDLHPHQLDHLGLKRSLEAMLDHATQASAIQFDARLETVDDLFSGDAAMNLYRIVQESVNNILKHSRASRVEVRLERDVREVLLQVVDDGVGFIVDKARNKKGLGLKNITERVRMLGGRLKLESSPGGGTRLEVTIPTAEPQH
jgi:PAS domain S-box-containing protein